MLVDDRLVATARQRPLELVRVEAVLGDDTAQVRDPIELRRALPVALEERAMDGLERSALPGELGVGC